MTDGLSASDVALLQGDKTAITMVDLVETVHG